MDDLVITQEEYTKIMLDAIMKNLDGFTKVAYPCKIDTHTKEAYEELLKKCAILKWYNIATFNYAPVEENFYMHEVSIKWHDDDIMSIDNAHILKAVSKIFELTEEFLIDFDEPNIWRFYIKIYKKR